MNSTMLRIRYSCHKCGLQRIEVRVEPRRDPDALGVAEWMGQVVIPAIALNHQARSPLCSAKQIDETLIPMKFPKEAGKWVGEPLTEEEQWRDTP